MPLLTTKNYKGPPEWARVHQVYRATLDQVWVAALKALSQLKASVTNETRNQAAVRSRTVGRGQPLAMHVEQIDANSIRSCPVGNSGTGRPRMPSSRIRENL